MHDCLILLFIVVLLNTNIMKPCIIYTGGTELAYQNVELRSWGNVHMISQKHKWSFLISFRIRIIHYSRKL